MHRSLYRTLQQQARSPHIWERDSLLLVYFLSQVKYEAFHNKFSRVDTMNGITYAESIRKASEGKGYEGDTLGNNAVVDMLAYMWVHWGLRAAEELLTEIYLPNDSQRTTTKLSLTHKLGEEAMELVFQLYAKETPESRL